ncbi:MAG: septum formation inhibitor Maf [Lachnospiraceae bacterium]|nr:septum formation inhibitor Maf [Lachnospiraceae bacterium]
MSDYKIILGSKSPRRKELLEQIGMEFEILVSDDEEVITSNVPSKVVEELSLQKAQNVEKMIADKHEKYIVIGADTVVAYDGRILGKPKDEDDAETMLKFLSGNTHQVYTGVTLIIKDKEKRETKNFAECTSVTMYDISEDEIRKYISTKEPMDKAGSYGIQGIGGKFIKEINGDYNNVVGLPVAAIYQKLKGLT